MALGFAVSSMISATLLSPLLGGWRNVVFLYGAISIGIGVIWTLTQPAPGERQSSMGGQHTATIRQVLSQVALNRNVWLLGLVIFGVGGCIQGLLGYLLLYLRDVGWPAARADGALATFHTVSLLIVIPLSLLSDRLGSRKTILIIAALTTVTGTGLLSVAEGPAVWGSVIIAGVFRDGFMAVFMTTIIELEGVGAAYAGTAIGFVIVFSGLGRWLAPPLGNSLADVGLGVPFVFWAAMAAAALLGLYFVKTTSRVKRLTEGVSGA
jgi:cyanate permease